MLHRSPPGRLALLLLPLLLPGGACSSTGRRPGPPPEPEPYEPPAPRAEYTTGELIHECQLHLQAWQQAMAAERTPENIETLRFLERALATLVRREQSRLEEQAATGPPRNRAIASAALGFSGDAGALPLLANNAADPDPMVRADALLGLAVLANPDTPTAPIYEAVMDPAASQEVLRNAAFAGLRLAQVLRRDPDGRVAAFLAPLLANPEPGVRAQAASALGLVRAAHLVPRLTSLLASDPEPVVRTAAAYALGEIGARGSASALVSALQDPDPVVAGTARGSLAKIVGRDLGPDPEDWQAALAG